MKRIAVLVSNYFPESNPAAKRYGALVSGLAKEGWTVTVVAPLPHYPQMELYPGFEHGDEKQESTNVRVHRIRPALLGKRGFVLRFIAELVYSIRALWVLLRGSQTVVLAACPYMALVASGYAYKLFRGAHFVWDVRDLTWQYVTLGSRSKFLHLLRAIMETVFVSIGRRADLVLTATNGQAEYFESKRFARVRFFPNGVNQAFLDELRHGCTRPIFSANSSRVTVTYAGLLGLPQGLHVLIEAARLLPSIEFRFVGDGVDKKRLETLAAQLDNVVFTGYVAKNELKAEYNRADILVAHLRNDPAFLLAQPSKVWEYMATGRPVIYGGEGEIVRILSGQGIAMTFDAEDSMGLVNAIRHLIHHPDFARRLGAQGQAFVNEHRNRDIEIKNLSSDLSTMFHSGPGRGFGESGR